MAKTTASYKAAVKAEQEKVKQLEVDKSDNNGIIRSSGKKSNSETTKLTKLYYVESGEIDFNDGNAITAEIKKFVDETVDSTIDKCRVISKNGKVYTVYGDKYTVNTTLLGDDMKGSINIHNHVKGESQYSFSREDLFESIRDGSYISMACDEKYLYQMVIDNHSTEDFIYNCYVQAELSVNQRMLDGEVIEYENLQHEVIAKTCELLGIRYRRDKL